MLLALQEHPVASAAALGRLVGVSPPTAKSWLIQLREDNVYTGVHADLRVHRLGLKIDDFLVLVHSFEALTKLERYCDEHPYTLYRARVYGGDLQGLLIQFRQPDDARKHLESALRKMESAGVIRAVRELPTLRKEYGSTYTTPKLHAWDSQSMSWTFDWKSWWARVPSGEIELPITPQTEDRIDLDILDVRLLEELTKDARQKNTDIITNLGMDKNKMGVQQKVSSKIKRLDQEAVESYRVFINWTHFDVYNTSLIIAKAREDVSNRLLAHLRKDPFPFESGIRKTSDGFVWSVRMPAAHLSELVALVWNISDSYEILNIDYKSSEFYGLWAQVFDERSRDWRTDKDFCHDAPLKSIGIT